jgi:prephenate dehydrogenase
LALFKKVGIVGVGLIGGSLGLAIKKYKVAKEVIGIVRRKKTAQQAIRRKVVDIASRNLNLLKDADLVILATPVCKIKEIAPSVSKVVKGECILTDVGSTKKEIVLKLEKLFPNYIGSHPLAGSQNAGLNFADADIFKSSLCIITPTRKTPPEVIRKITVFWNKIGAKVSLLSPSLHDKILSYTSHLPHMVAFALMELIPSNYLNYSATGLRDTTRIALSSPELWRDIFISNRKEILTSLREFGNKLYTLENLLSQRDVKSLYLFLKKAQRKRSKLL